MIGPINRNKKKRAGTMQDILQPIIHKAPVLGLRINIGRSGLCIGDMAELRQLDDGQIGIFAPVRKHLLGFIPWRAEAHLGQLGPAAVAIIGEAIQQGQHLRVRIVGLTPEHLSASTGPEVHISIWGDAARLQAHRFAATL